MEQGWAHDVAVLVLAHDREVGELPSVVPVDQVFVVGRDLDRARAAGARVVETLADLDRAAAVDAGLRAFRLAERFPFVLVVDAGVRIDPAFLDHARPLLDAAESVDPHVVVPGSLPARAVAVTERLRTRHPSLSVARGAPPIARLSRSAALGHPDGLDSPGAFSTRSVVTADRAHDPAWFWREFRGGRLRGDRVATGYAVGRVVAAVLMVVWPVVVAGLAVLDPRAALVAVAVVVLPDYLVTLVVGRVTPAALLFPLRRVAESWTFLRSWRGAPPTPLPRTWLLYPLAAAALVWRTATASVPPTPTEPALVDAAYAGLAPDVTAWQLRAYTSLTDAFARHDSTLTAARELSAAALVVTLLALAAVTALLRVRPWVTALVIAATALGGPAVTALAPIGPGPLVGMWLSLTAAAGLAAVARRNAVLGLVALTTAVAALLTAWPAGGPTARGALTVALVLIATALLATARRAAVLGPIAVLPTLAAVAAAWPAEPPSVLAVPALLAAAGAVAVPWLRPVVPVVVVGALTGGAPLVLVTAGLVAVLLDHLLDRRPRARVGVAVLALGVAALGVVVPPVGRPGPDHRAIAAWARANLPEDATLVAPAGLWSDLRRDGVPVRAATDAPGDLVLTSAVPEGVELARFGDVAVVLPDAANPYLDPASRARAGAQLADNTRLHASDEVREALRGGRVDLRAMAVLAGLCREHDVVLTSTGKPAHESTSALPDRVLTLSTSDSAALAEWLRAQQPPFAPDDVRTTPDGVAVGWRLPALTGTTK
ncbi:hypothetical protein [Actinosynnema sp. NPDC020468]|uniref:hypothetical protein n=1 Tax=Actinosynnema sp. NPDC020468 TaxID=3154488 RepID=UPI0033DC1C9E